MQKYYLHRNSSYYQYFESIHTGCLEYIVNRCNDIVIPNIMKLKQFFTGRSMPILHVKLCSARTDRSDLHRFFRKTYDIGKTMGYDAIYPMEDDTMADFVEEIKPVRDDIVISKTTFSPFSSSSIDSILREHDIGKLVFTGLATSQCVESSARDASDRGFEVIHIEDAQADYDEVFHNASLYSSQGVCGGFIMTTEEFIQIYDNGSKEEITNR